MNAAVMMAQAAQQGAGSIGGMLIPMVLVFGLFYFMMIRPQQRKEKERQKLIGNVKTGDRVIFSGGILGTVANVKEKSLVVKVADGVKMEILRGAVTSVLDKDEKLGAEEVK